MQRAETCPHLFFRDFYGREIFMAYYERGRRTFLYIFSERSSML